MFAASNAKEPNMTGDDYLMRSGVHELTSRWWVVLVRGLAAIAFGVITFFAPKISLMTLVILWGGYVFIDGVSSLVMATKAGRHWGWLLFEGAVSVAAGVLAFIRPQLTALALLMLIALRALLGGIAEIVTALQLRRHVEGEWRLALVGALSVGFGLLLVAAPGTGAMALLWMIGTYAVIFGALLVALSLRLHHWHRDTAGPDSGAAGHA
jgi:uncharacterized membrane protein HdeD (DUF308 family)